MSHEEHLYKLVFKWEKEARSDRREAYPYVSTLDEVLFHGRIRFGDYEQFKEEGAFPLRLKAWLENLNNERQRKTLFKLLPHLLFIDQNQLKAFYRDAYRRIIVPWICGNDLTVNELLAADYEAQVQHRVREYRFLSITESFSFPIFNSVNNLVGFEKPIVIGEDIRVLDIHLNNQICQKGAIVFEDFVGTGKQARAVLKELRRQMQPQAKLIFIPLIALDIGVKRLRSLKDIEISPVLMLPSTSCLKNTALQSDPPVFKEIRSLIRTTAQRVLTSYGTHDDPPTNAFGYKNSGALLITAHNVPNNSLPIIHHRAPSWTPLFRRLHHKGKGSQDFLR